MPSHDEGEACRALIARFAWAAAVGAGFLLAATLETAAKEYAVDCKLSPPIFKDGCIRLVLKNTTGRRIPAGRNLKVRFCNASGCWPYSFEMTESVEPGQTISWCEFPLGYPGPLGNPDTDIAQSCTATIDIPELFEEKPKPPVKEYSRTRPPGPPQPGLLEESPGVSRQAPSSVGTPKPSAPPPGAAPPSSIIR
jgi:hypothetical protein